MKKQILVLCCLFFLGIATAQNSVDYSAALIQNLISEIFQYGLFVLALYEVVVRFFPTVKSYSLLTQIIAILQMLIPDRTTEGGTHNLINQSLTVNDVKAGDIVKTEDGTGRVLDVSDNILTVRTKEGLSDIPIEKVIEIVKTGYALVDALKSIISFIKGLLKK